MEYHLEEQLFYLEESQCILWKIILENCCFTWKRANASYGRSSWRTAVLPGREPMHLMEDHLGEQLFYLEESQCFLWKIILGNSCFTWKRASSSYGRSTWRTAVLPGREPVHLIGRSSWVTLFYLEESQCILWKTILANPVRMMNIVTTR